jgi:purine-binding chemotaxis protein CheW
VEALRETEAHIQLLTFLIGEEEYAVGIHRAREIIEYPPITQVPGTPGYIRGVLNLRGRVVPVVDLGRKFGLPSSPVTNRSCVVIVEVDLGGESAVMGVVADAVSQVIDLSREEIEEPPSFGTQVRVDYLLGMGRSGQRFVLLLDIDRILSEGELLAAAQAAEETDADPGSDAADAAAAAVDEAAV